MDYRLAFGVCQCNGVKFNAMPGINVKFGTEVHLRQVETQRDANCSGVFVGELCLGHNSSS